MADKQIPDRKAIGSAFTMAESLKQEGHTHGGIAFFGWQMEIMIDQKIALDLAEAKGAELDEKLAHLDMELFSARARVAELQSQAETNARVCSGLHAALAERTHQFANFHRSLSARFGYSHDPVDWFRDQVSLEEHIAAKMAELEAKLDHLEGQYGIKRVEVAEQAAAIEQLKATLTETWKTASRFSTKTDACCHPDVPIQEMNEAAKTAMHSTAQQIAWEIKDLVDAALKPKEPANG
jgi:uncharacterized coiled-coil protein SlyX